MQINIFKYLQGFDYNDYFEFKYVTVFGFNKIRTYILQNTLYKDIFVGIHEDGNKVFKFLLDDKIIEIYNFNF